MRRAGGTWAILGSAARTSRDAGRRRRRWPGLRRRGNARSPAIRPGTVPCTVESHGPGEVDAEHQVCRIAARPPSGVVPRSSARPARIRDH
jgi:hypothetical protein